MEASGGSWGLKLRGAGEPGTEPGTEPEAAPPDAPLFLPIIIDGRVQHADAYGERKVSLSDQAVYKMVKRRYREANVTEISPHDFHCPAYSDYHRCGLAVVYDSH